MEEWKDDPDGDIGHYWIDFGHGPVEGITIGELLYSGGKPYVTVVGDSCPRDLAVVLQRKPKWMRIPMPAREKRK